MAEKQHIHILGICGTAMAAVAKLARDMGFDISGSDQGVYPPMSDFLAGEGIAAFEGYDVAHLDPRPDLVVIGNAMSRGNTEVEAVLDQQIPYMSAPEFLGRQILLGRHSVVVAGTHGKTSTASLMAHVLEVAGKHPGFMIGGVPENFGGGARLGEGEAFVLEGDEYDTAFFDKRSKFLHYQARTLILNNLEYDHADIFPNLEAIKMQFHHLIRTVPGSGRIVCNSDDSNLKDVLARGCWTPVAYFSEKRETSSAEWQWETLQEDGSRFRLWHAGEVFLEAEWGMIGRHQVSNACAVAAVAVGFGIAAEVIGNAFDSFAGIRRRMTLVGEAGGVHVYDDFAHHPTAIRGVVQAMKSRMQDGRLWVVVEPRSNTMRTRIHQDALPKCFAGADRVLFVPPSERNLNPGEVLDANAVCGAIGSHADVLPDVASIVDLIGREAKSGDAVLVLSNGGFDGIHHKLLAHLAR